ncbi:PAS domain S-box protein [Parasediminibacterium sp. JCM 36343]|uniref:PAS domain-containing sensor histidine kinase n=1 Tax=Parasediminibacterium sp. JCM 36343 TaxID=3374279 RepID=UPI00397B3079
MNMQDTADNIGNISNDTTNAGTEMAYTIDEYFLKTATNEQLREYITVLQQSNVQLQKQSDAFEAEKALLEVERKKDKHTIAFMEETKIMNRVGGWELDLIHHQLYWSPVTKSIHEVAPNFEPDLETAICFYKEGKNRDIIRQLLKDGEENGTSWDVELQIVTGNCNEIWVRSIGKSNWDGEKCTRLYGTFQDIEEQKQQKIKLRASEAKYGSIASNAMYGIMVANEANQLTEVNKAALDMFGYTEAEFIALPLKVFFDVTDPGFRAAGLEIAKEGKASGTVTGITKNGARFPCDFCSNLFTYEDGTSGYTIMVADVTESKKKERIITEERLLLRTLIDNLPANIYVKDLLSKKKIANKVEYEFCGAATEAEVLGKDDYAYFPAEIAKRNIEEDQSVIATGIAIINKESFFTSASGKKKWLAKSKMPLLDALGKIVGLIGISYDITDRKEAEHAIIEERILLRTLIDNLPMNVYVKDMQSRKTLVNRAEYEYMGAKSEEEVLGKDDTDLYPTESSRISLAEDREVFATGVPIIGKETTNTRHDGSTTWFLSSKIPLKNAGGEIIGLLGLSYNITNRKKTEAQLLESREIMQQSLNELSYQRFAIDQHAVVAVTDTKGTIVYANDKFAQISKYTKEELMGQNHRILKSGHHPKTFYEDMYRTIASGKVWKGEFCNRAKDGSIYWVDSTIVPFIDKITGKVISYISIRTDITDRKNHEMALQHLSDQNKKKTDELAIINKELEQFAYITSHDLQEPLRMVSSFLQLLEKKYHNQLDEKGRQYIHFAVDGATRMKRLIMDLLEYSRAGTVKEVFVKVNTQQVVEDLKQDFGSMISEKNGHIIAGSLPVINGSLTQLRQLFQNLVGNALKYQKPDNAPTISIAAEESNTHWTFSVKDNGIGIEPAFFNKIFVIFQRLHNRDEYSGTGIGLAICKKIVENHHGAIWVESVMGEGSCFYFTIPK